jgi:hypothetical protein
MKGNDTSLETIKNLFYAQVKDLTMRTRKMDSFDVQFSGSWVR